MILGIDAFNIKSGGGVTHLVEMLSKSNPYKYNFNKVIIWGNSKLLNKIEDREWLQKEYVGTLNRGLFCRAFWHRFKQAKAARNLNCDIVYAPGGVASSGFSPIVTMSRNMLPFEWQEMKRFGLSTTTIKLIILRFVQILSFKKADGLIFLTYYAKKIIYSKKKINTKFVSVIPHGVSEIFFQRKARYNKRCFSQDNPCKVLYVSNIAPYKHQWGVIEAIYLLRKKNIPITLDLVGPIGASYHKMIKVAKKLDPQNKFVNYYGEIEYKLTPNYYSAADIGVFASSCENMPNTLLEGMASGIPMACSKLGPMPEIMGDSELYFDPLNPKDIAFVIEKMFYSKELRDKSSKKSVYLAKNYKWSTCADETFSFLKQVAENY